jgi:hypothetical protein
MKAKPLTCSRVVLAPRLLGTFTAIPREDIWLEHTPMSPTSAEVRSLDKRFDERRGRRDDAKLRIWRVTGEFATLDRGLFAR